MSTQADAVHIPFADKSVHCCVTSPPYWGLRKYAGEQGEEPLGLEATPERHVERIVEIMREVKRVLRDDGVLWLNYGDCYATTQNGRAAADIENDDRTFRDKPFNTAQFTRAGSLMMMPHRVALAATMAAPVFTRVSQATRAFGSWARIASRTASEIWSASLSGWPSETDSEVKR